MKLEQLIGRDVLYIAAIARADLSIKTWWLTSEFSPYNPLTQLERKP
jgi:hypothetical protein